MILISQDALIEKFIYLQCRMRCMEEETSQMTRFIELYAYAKMLEEDLDNNGTQRSMNTMKNI